MLKSFFLIFAIFFYFKPQAQQNNNVQFNLGTNPFSLLEQNTAIGICASAKFTNKFELWAEYSFLFNSRYFVNNWKNLKGYRLLIQPRYYINQHNTIFFGAEFRLKNLNFLSTYNYINKNNSDTLMNFATNENQKIIGGAVVIGKHIKLSKRCKLELTTGFGARVRLIFKKDVPPGYNYAFINRARGISFIREDYYQRKNGKAYYLPLGARFIWEIK